MPGQGVAGPASPPPTRALLCNRVPVPQTEPGAGAGVEGWLLWGPRDGVSAHSPLPSGYQSPLAGFPAVLPSSSTRKGSWDQVEEDLGTQTHQVPAPQDTLLQSWWLQRRDPAIRSEEGLPRHDRGFLPVADGTWPQPVYPQLPQLWPSGRPRAWGQGAGAAMSTVTRRCLGLCASVFPCEVQPPWQGCQ